MEILKRHKCFAGETQFGKHFSAATQTEMNFSLFKPTGTVKRAIIWLSGLTCSEENFITKSGVQALLAESDTLVFCPDTSPRGLMIAGADDDYDFGTAASFYVNATEGEYAKHYQMYDYIVQDVVSLLHSQFDLQQMSIMGHSMGGHGALTIGLRNPGLFHSISAFSPICNPINCTWGQKAFRGYLGDDERRWALYDACDLLQSGCRSQRAILISQGLADAFYPHQLQTDRLVEMAETVGQPLDYRAEDGYDHSYFFIATFLRDHIYYHLANG